MFVYYFSRLIVHSLTRRPRAGCSGDAPWPVHVPGRKGHAACQVVQRHHDTHIADLGHDSRQISAQCRRRSGCCTPDTRATHHQLLERDTRATKRLFLPDYDVSPTILHFLLMH